MRDIILLGAGKIGEMIVEMLATCGDYKVTVGDFSQENLDRMPKHANVTTQVVDVSNEDALRETLRGKYAVLCALPYNITPYIAKAAKAEKVNYFDLTEDVACTRLVKDLAKDAETAFMPQCGLAPGFISIIAHDIAQTFDKVQNLHLRVGALPQYPTNSISYNLTWSTDGVINEYCEPCEAIVDGRLIETEALSGMETFSLDGIKYEAFNTSGGLGTLCETYAGRVENLNYRTIRYPGHRDVMKTLIEDLRLGERRDVFKDVLENSIPATMQDVVITFVSVSGWKGGRLMQENYANKIYAREIGGKVWSAIQITTAAGICAVLDLMAEGKLPQKGFVRQEDVKLADFLANRFGKAYAQNQPESRAA
ncbi:MAG: saccharopine dehydrogenase family protein [Alphaproteobacteria bacterium]|nr:MAG: saccharopine dehydrogenase family protein [Alphaproteobacteria bacterium]